MSDFSRRVLALRRERGLTQAQLADRAGLSTAGLSRFERGLAPSFEHVIRIADALNASRDELLRLAACQFETRVTR